MNSHISKTAASTDGSCAGNWKSGRMDPIEAEAVAERLFMEGLNLSTEEVLGLIDKTIAHNYALLTKDPVVRAEGVWLHTRNGRKIFDGVAAYSAANLGHNHPLVVSMVRHVLDHQSPTVLGRFLPNGFMSLMGRKITEMTGFENFLPANGGVEAPDAAIKLARRWGYRIKKVKGTPEVIYFTHSFHGRSLTFTQCLEDACSLQDFGPFAPGFIVTTYGDIEALKKAVTKNTIAILIEPIQGEGGINIPPDGYLPELHKIARENQILVIYDEVQTGWGRTASFSHGNTTGRNIGPDIMCIGKSISGGFTPVAGILASRELMDMFEPGSHGSTFGGCPISSAIAYAAMTAIQMEDLPNQSKIKGEYVMSRLKEIAAKSRHIVEVRGKGLMIGIQVKEDGPDGHAFADKLYEEGMICKDTHRWVLRFTPPIIATKAELDLALGMMEKVFTR